MRRPPDQPVKKWTVPSCAQPLDARRKNVVRRGRRRQLRQQRAIGRGGGAGEVAVTTQGMEPAIWTMRSRNSFADSVRARPLKASVGVEPARSGRHRGRARR
jgi:hypothetical protein